MLRFPSYQPHKAYHTDQCPLCNCQCGGVLKSRGLSFCFFRDNQALTLCIFSEDPFPWMGRLLFRLYHHRIFPRCQYYCFYFLLQAHPQTTGLRHLQRIRPLLCQPFRYVWKSGCLKGLCSVHRLSVNLSYTCQDYRTYPKSSPPNSYQLVRLSPHTLYW